MKSADKILEQESRENDLLKLRALALSTHFGQVILSVIYTHSRISVNELLSECQVPKEDLVEFLSLLKEAKLITVRGDKIAVARQGKQFLANVIHLSD
jgi:predicted methyltransferase